ncbi:hypothetical protein [Kumtagia ephedrae]|uniref:hypothetical protein n=1 Tax=Kumtagia ephedrae TaxID=2116701 RepID=UPI0010573852|nr:hypothetical protein [Mesorhizobium ephedrae]
MEKKTLLAEGVIQIQVNQRLTQMNEFSFLHDRILIGSLKSGKDVFFFTTDRNDDHADIILLEDVKILSITDFLLENVISHIEIIPVEDQYFSYIIENFFKSSVEQYFPRDKDTFMRYSAEGLLYFSLTCSYGAICNVICRSASIFNDKSPYLSSFCSQLRK